MYTKINKSNGTARCLTLDETKLF